MYHIKYSIIFFWWQYCTSFFVFILIKPTEAGECGFDRVCRLHCDHMCRELSEQNDPKPCYYCSQSEQSDSAMLIFSAFQLLCLLYVVSTVCIVLLYIQNSPKSLFQPLSAKYCLLNEKITFEFSVNFRFPRYTKLFMKTFCIDNEVQQ